MEKQTHAHINKLRESKFGRHSREILFGEQRNPHPHIYIYIHPARWSRNYYIRNPNPEYEMSSGHSIVANMPPMKYRALVA